MSISITSFTGNNENFLCGKRVIRKISNAGSRVSSGPYHGLELPIHGISLSATRHVDISGSEAKTHPRSSSVLDNDFFVCSSSEPSKNLLVPMSSKNFVIGDSGTGLLPSSLPSHYLDQCWLIVKWTLWLKLQLNSNIKHRLLIQQNVVWKLKATFFQAWLCKT